MKTIHHRNILSYHDGPQIIQANDDDGQNYLGLWVEPDGSQERFVFKAVAADRINSFLLGLVDLRTLLLEHSEDEWFLGTPGGSIDEPFALKVQNGSMDEYDWLPAPGFFLSEPNEQIENPSGRETGGVSAGKPLEIGPPPLRREVEERSLNPG